MGSGRLRAATSRPTISTVVDGVGDEVDELRSQVAELARNVQRLRTALDNSTDMVFYLEIGGDWSANNTVTRELGFHPDYHPDHPVELVHPDDRASALRALASVVEGTWAETQPLIVRIRHADDRYDHYELRGRRVLGPDGPEAVVITARNVNAELAARAEARWQQAQRLESVHRLGAGVAHDFCNLVGAVANHLTIIERHAQLDGAAVASITSARDALTIAGDLSRRLLQFGDTNEQATSTIDLVDVIKGVDTLIRPTLPRDVDLRYEVPDHPVLVEAARGEWEQIMLNLALNAGEAMVGHGTIHITLATEADVVECRVRDDGLGMPAHVRDRAFDPFFTTKSTANASGLGLSTVFSFVRGAGGTVEIDSAPQEGTTVRVRWPRAT